MTLSGPSLKKYRWPLALVCLVAVAVVAAGCRGGRLVSTSQEVEVGQDAAKQIESENRVITGTADARRVQTISARIINTRERGGIDYSVKLLDKKEINAFALPGGFLYVNQGLVDFIRREPIPTYPGNPTQDDLLAGVIAHEMAHVEARHHAKMMERSAIAGIAISTIGGKSQDWAGIFANLSLLQFSRDDEYEADKLGINYANRAGYNPFGMAAFLKVLQDKHGSGGSGLAEFFRTHPNTGDRVRRAEDRAREVGGS